MVFFWIFARDYGLLVYAFDALGLQSPLWLYDPFWAKVTITIMAVWLKMGYYFLVLLAGLKNISPTYYEAAEIDGASGWKKLWNIAAAAM
jgi:multiple sugar transport system permease protein